VHNEEEQTMKQIRMLGAAIVAVVASSAVAFATASAALPEFVPGAAGTTFTGASGAGTLQMSGGTMECASDTVKGELTSTTTGTATIAFKGCSVFTLFGAKSLDAESAGEILAHVDVAPCYTNKAKKVVGMIIATSKPVHVEIAGKLIEILGAAVGELLPANTKTTKFKLVFKQKGGVQEPAGCEGKPENLSARENEKGEFKDAGEQTSEEIVFTIAQTLAA
jgi:hypothetical protein